MFSNTHYTSTMRIDYLPSAALKNPELIKLILNKFYLMKIHKPIELLKQPRQEMTECLLVIIGHGFEPGNFK